MAASVHGTSAAYQGGCRCLPCRYARSEYMREYRRGGVRTVPAASVRRRLDALIASGMTLTAVASLAGVSTSSLREIRKGRQRRITKRLAEAVYGVQTRDFSANHNIPGDEALRVLDLILSTGLTRRDVARSLGYRGRNLNFSYRRSVSLRNYHRLALIVRYLVSIGSLSPSDVPNDLWGMIE